MIGIIETRAANGKLKASKFKLTGLSVFMAKSTCDDKQVCPVPNASDVVSPPATTILADSSAGLVAMSVKAKNDPQLFAAPTRFTTRPLIS